jgi:hypothetical protein
MNERWKQTERIYRAARELDQKFWAELLGKERSGL